MYTCHSLPRHELYKGQMVVMTCHYSMNSISIRTWTLTSRTSLQENDKGDNCEDIGRLPDHTMCGNGTVHKSGPTIILEKIVTYVAHKQLVTDHKDGKVNSHNPQKTNNGELKWKMKQNPNPLNQLKVRQRVTDHLPKQSTTSNAGERCGKQLHI